MVPRDTERKDPTMQTRTLADRAGELAEAAIALRAEHQYNCAQAVACALAPEVGGDVDAVYRLSEGFGAGMGGHKETCGALSGAVMVLGQLRSAGTAEPGATKQKTYKLASELVEGFREANGSVLCRELKGIGCDHGPLRSCPGCIEDAVRGACLIIDAYRAGERG